MTAGWRVFAEWCATASVGRQETSTERPDWQAARSEALQLACLSGVRYVVVQDLDGVVAGEYDRYTNRWREYRRHLGALPFS